MTPDEPVVIGEKRTLSGDAEHVYVTAPDGSILSTHATLADAEKALRCACGGTGRLSAATIDGSSGQVACPWCPAGLHQWSTAGPDEMWHVEDRRTGQRVGVASYFSEGSAAAAIREWRERHAKGGRPDITADLLENLRPAPSASGSGPENGDGR